MESLKTVPLENDPFVELRFYYVAPGRMHDMVARAQNDLKKLFARHGVEPLAMWRVVSGPAVPAMVYLTPWTSMQQRSKSWAGFYADPDWASARERTNAGTELVERFEAIFLRSVIDWDACDVLTPAPVGSDIIVEMVVQSVTVGRGAQVRATLIEQTLPALRAAGATVHGVFDVMTGRSLPSIVYFVSWPNSVAHYDARADDDHQIVTPGSVLERADHYVMRAIPIEWQR